MNKLKVFTRIIIAVCALAMIPSNFVSVWQIQLEAPQYPEGLKMEIWSHKLAGDIDKINGLGLGNYSFYIYFIPLNDVDNDKLQIMRSVFGKESTDE